LFVRSSAEYSMPGVMDSIMIGLNEEVVRGLEWKYGKIFAGRLYEFFLRTYAQTIYGLPEKSFILAQRKIFLDRENMLGFFGVMKNTELMNAYNTLFRHMETGRRKIHIPDDPKEQILAMIEHSLRLWHSDEMKEKRKNRSVPEDSGFALLIQRVVHGNLDYDSFSAVVFTRDPNTGANILDGSWYPNSLNSDLVWGIHTGWPIDMLKEDFSDISQQLWRIKDILEKKYKDVFELEVLGEQGELELVQARSARLSLSANERVIQEMFEEGLLTQDEYVYRATQLMEQNRAFYQLKEGVSKKVLYSSRYRSPGALKGFVAFSRKQAEEWLREGMNVILVIKEEERENFELMFDFPGQVGIITMYGSDVIHEAQQTRAFAVPALINIKAGRRTNMEGRKKIEKLLGGVSREDVYEGQEVVLDGHRGELVEVSGKEEDIFDPWQPTSFISSLGESPVQLRKQVRGEVKEALRARGPTAYKLNFIMKFFP